MEAREYAKKIMTPEIQQKLISNAGTVLGDLAAQNKIAFPPDIYDS